jgi:hypothetical protein
MRHGNQGCEREVQCRHRCWKKGSPRLKNESGWLQRKIESICARQLMTPIYRSDSLVALSVAAGKSTPSDHDSRRSAPDVFGSPRWNASPIVCLCRLRHCLLLERGTLPGNVWGWGLSCGRYQNRSRNRARPACGSRLVAANLRHQRPSCCAEIRRPASPPAARASGHAAALPSSVTKSRRLIHPPAINQAAIG